MKPREFLGLICGYPLGALTGTISFIRASRMFHPSGIIAQAEVINLRPYSIFPKNALVRFSGAWWKRKEWIDVLGIAIRFDDKQDLLFASFKYAWQTPIGPLLTKYKNFFANSYYAVSPFTFEGKTVQFKLIPKQTTSVRGSREKILRANLSSSSLTLFMKEKKKEWIAIAEIKLLKEETGIDQERLKFNPFLNGLRINPEGFIQYLRIGSYRLSQFGRSLR